MNEIMSTKLFEALRELLHKVPCGVLRHFLVSFDEVPEVTPGAVLQHDVDLLAILRMGDRGLSSKIRTRKFFISHMSTT